MANENKIIELLGALKDGILDVINKLVELISIKQEDEIEGIIETYEVTATTNMLTLWPPPKLNKGKPDERHKWLWVQVINDSETIDATIGLNVGSANALTIKAGENYKISFANRRKIEYMNYKTASGTVALRIICAR